MKHLVAWFANNSVAANLLLLLLFIGGGSTLLFTLKQESFPLAPTENILVTVPYPGATPEEVEESICIKIEEAVQAVDDVDRIVTTANENMGMVDIEIRDGADINAVLDDVKVEVDAIDTFPEDAEEPIIKQAKITERVVSLMIRGEASERTLKVIADRLRDELLMIPDITKAEVTNAREYEISIEVEEAALRRHRLDFDHVTQAIRRQSINLPAGSVRTEEGEILFRSSAQAYTREEFERIPVFTLEDGTRLALEDVATVRFGFEDVDRVSRLDGIPSLMIQTYRVAEQSTPDVAKKVLAFTDEARKRLPEGIELVVWRDESQLLADRLDLFKRNGAFGLALVFIVLALFLKARLAWWVAVGLAAAVFGAIWVMPTFDISLNLLSSFGFIVVLGILVDDAIVVGENINAHRRMGKPALKAAIEGTHEVLVPVSLAVVTTGIAFSPMLRMPGSVGTFAGTIASVVIVAIFFSLVESLLILPAHLGHDDAVKPEKGIVRVILRGLGVLFGPIARGWNAFQSRVSGGLDAFIERIYKPALAASLSWRYLTLSIGVAFLILTFGLVRGGWVKFSFFPAIEGDTVLAVLELRPAASPQETSRALDILEAAAMQVRDEIEGDRPGSVVRHIHLTLGDQPGARTAGPPHDATPSASNRANEGEVQMALVPNDRREISATEIADRWRALVEGRLHDALELNITANLMGAGAPIDIELAGEDMAVLTAAAQALKDKIATYPGTYNISDDNRSGKPEFTLHIKPSGAALGLTQRDVARQVRQGFYGDEAQRVQIGKDDVKVFVRYPEAERRSLANLENMRIRLPGGGEVPFHEVAAVESGRGPAAIKRIDRQRTIVVTGDLDRAIMNANEVTADLVDRYLPAFLQDHPGVSYHFGGEQSRQKESVESLAAGMVLALFMMFGLLAVVFKSYMQPLIVMSIIPFGASGAIWAHYFIGLDLTILSVIGILALMGVVVNDSLVMIDFINRFRRDRGMRVHTAVLRAPPRRFRAVTLTSLTTFVGLLPIFSERSVQAALVIPMAVSLAFGVAFATIITLFIVPSGYLVLDDLKKLLVGGETRDAMVLES